MDGGQREVLASHFASFEKLAVSDHKIVTLSDLLVDGARALVAEHARQVAAGEAASAVAKYLVGWYGGAVAAALGSVYTRFNAGLLVDRTILWAVHPGGWPEGVDAHRCTLAVAPGHPWAGGEGVLTAPDDTTVRELAVRALAEFLEPLVSACRGLAKVGSNSLWGEVADGLGLEPAASMATVDTQSRIERLDLLLTAEAAPWRTRPRTWVAAGAGGAVVVGQKGGCCLAFSGSSDRSLEPADDHDRAYLMRFPPAPGDPDYCLTCSLRTAEDAEARQVFWAERRIPRGHPTSD